ncbi:Cell wall-associated hydrolase [Fructobacillus tropaeoli]|uniref:peptidoglycan amidohydrolase family protein n=1 Tax=Fructobacillus tropaeoli TaxID=709323 RepID=UPI002DB3445F|nr:Cell wall-associated hydrolase [Fructobacillus tropaeoli]
MMHNNQDNHPRHRLMFTAGATTLAATGAVFGATVLNQNQTASADQVQGQAQSQVDQQSQWQANSLEQVKAAIEKQGQGQNIHGYATQWGDTLGVIAQAYGLSTEQAAQQLGLDDQGLLISGYRLGDQAQVIQKLKNAGVLLSAGAVQISQSQTSQPNLVLMQKGAPTTDSAQVAADSQAISQAISQGSQTGSQAATTAAAQSVAQSQSLSVTSSQATAQSMTANVNQSQASQAPSISGSSAGAQQANTDKTYAMEQNATQVAGSQSVDLYSQTQSLSQAQAAASQTPSSQVTVSQAGTSQVEDSEAVTSQAQSSQAATSQATNSEVATSQASSSQEASSEATTSQEPASQAVPSQAPASQAVVSEAPASQEVTSQAATSQAPASTSVAVQPTATTNKVNTDQVINWFYDHQGKLTYSMTGSRNGADGTADCSGAMTEALYEAGASKPAYLYNTDSLHGYLEQNGYQLISTNTPWDAQRGDIVIWGQQGASGGSAGHVQIIVSNDPNARAISVNYVTGGQTGTAVQEWNYDAAYNYTANANGGSLAYYVYRQV